MPKIKPLGDRVLIKAEAVEQKIGKLILADDGQEKKPEIGVIVDIGVLEDPEEFPAKIGDRVVFKKYAPDEIESEGEKYLIVEVSDILAIINK